MPGGIKNMVSIKDIAGHCGVSVATVSKALNGHTDISQKTRELIQQAAEEMGYHPNSLARALKTNRTYNIGVLFVDESLNGLTHDYFSHVLDGFRVCVEKHGYDITFINSSPGSMSYLKHSLYRGFDGVVMACINFYDPNVIELADSQIPIVTIDHPYEHRISVLSDNEGGISELVKYVISMGHKKIAYIHGNDSTVTRMRLKGFCKTMKSCGEEVREEYVLASNYRNPDNAFKLTKKLLAFRDRPTCILYSDDYSCLGGINALNEAGLNIPGDISIAGFDGIFLSQFLSPKLTTYRQDSDRIGRIAAEKLMQLIENYKTPQTEHITVSGKVLRGESVAAPSF